MQSAGSSRHVPDAIICKTSNLLTKYGGGLKLAPTSVLGKEAC